jgi:hypothetical protein
MESLLRESNSQLQELPLPSATTAVVFFFIMTVIYGFIMIYTTINSASLSQVVINSKNQIYTLIYIIFLLSGTYFINVNISKSICNENTIQWGKVFMITILPWIIIFGVLYLLLELFPGWAKPFSNTIGYLVVNTLGVTNLLKQILKSHSNEERNSTLKKALENIEKNYSRFINEIDVEQEKYESFIKQLSRESFTKISSTNTDNSKELFENPKVIELFALINIKDIIGRLFWYALAGTLIASISYNFIINMNCEKTVDQTTEDYDKLFAKQNGTISGTIWEKIDYSDIGNKQNYNHNLQSFLQLYDEKFKDGPDVVKFTYHQTNNIYGALPDNIYIRIDKNNDDDDYYYYIPTE